MRRVSTLLCRLSLLAQSVIWFQFVALIHRPAGTGSPFDCTKQRRQVDLKLLQLIRRYNQQALVKRAAELCQEHGALR